MAITAYLSSAEVRSISVTPYSLYLREMLQGEMYIEYSRVNSELTTVDQTQFQLTAITHIQSKEHVLSLSN